MGVDEQDPDRSSRLELDEQEPVDEQSQVEAGGGRRWMNSSPWRLEEVEVARGMGQVSPQPR